MRTSRIRMQLVAVLSVLLAAQLHLPYAAAAEPSVDEMVDALARKQTVEPAAGGTRMRSFASKPAVAATGRLQLSVQFEFASARVSPESRDLLVKLGSAMNSSALADRRFRIEGHTDSTGDAQGNLRLSEQRARNVKQFLTNNAGVNETRLSATGKGSSEPRDAADPKATVNRRVVVFALDDAASGSGLPPPVPQSSSAGKAAGTQAGTIQGMQGEASVARANASIALGTGDAVFEGDLISTAAGGSVVVRLDDGAKLLARPNTRIILSRIENAGALDKLSHSIELMIGAMRYVTGSVGKSRPEAVRFKTPIATVGIRGTDVDIVHAPTPDNVSESGTYVRVNAGGIELAAGDGSIVTLAVNEQAFAAPQGPKMRGGGRAPAAIKLAAPAPVFSTGELDSLLTPR